MTNAAPPSCRRPASENWSGGAGGDDLLERGLEAQPPQLAHELLGRVARVVGEEDDPLARLAQGGERLRGALGGLLADPQAAVEVEQEVVVATGDGGERHAASLSSAPMSRLPMPVALLLACALIVAACGGDEKEKTASAPAADRDRPSPRQEARLREGRRAQAGKERKLPKPTLGAQGGQDLRGARAHQLRRVRDHARPQARPEDRRLVRVARRQALLRRPDLPPHRPRLRDPGRRPQGRRPGRPRLHRRRGAAEGPHLQQGRGGDGQDRAPSRPAPRAASSSS